MESNSTASKPKLSLPLITRLQIAAFTYIIDFVRRPDYTINRRLLHFIDLQVSANPTPRDGVSTHDVTLDAARNLSLRLFIPSTAADASSPVPVIVYFHGGGFVYMSPGSVFYDAFCRRLSRRLGAVIASVDYRLAPEHKFPAQYDDAIDVLRFLDDPARRKTLIPWPDTADVSRCFIAGDSAGGNIAHHAVVRAAEARLSELRVLGLVTIQPFFGGEGRSESEIRLKGAPVVSMESADWMWKAFYPDELGRDHWACNVSGPNAKDLSGLDLPATMVVVAGFDPLQDRQREYCEWLRDNGKETRVLEYPNSFHGFNVFPEVAESTALIDEIQGFMNHQMSQIS